MDSRVINMACSNGKVEWWDKWNMQEIFKWEEGCLRMYILVFIQGIAWISALEIFLLSSLTLAVAGADFLRPPSLKVAGRVSSMKIVA